ncbi:unnamed protein product [Caenorhabditis bovis]|uniref:Calcineurin-like phosphoesterase domain-containing protein n=1 Tax=Caenorhabditis bovis TaxID=2654633 RepID=A0A8S1E629_9PELO|nr:unnamed protein product [Caenorhabditis bovis]
MLSFFVIVLLIASTAPYQVLHLADFHLDVNYSIYGDNQKMCHDDGSKTNKTLGQFGDYMCDSPLDLVVYAINEVYRLFPTPDLIIWTGDNVAHVDGYGWDTVIDALNITTSLIFQKYPGITILPTFGNHDYAPANGFVSDSNLYSRTWEFWRSKLGDENRDTFFLGGYYKYQLPNATAVVLNTNLYYNVNKAYANFTDKSDPAGQFAFLESELQNAENCRNRVLANCSSTVHIIAHIGPGVFERTPNYTWFRDEYNERFLNLTVRYAKTIGWMLFGHHHTDTFHIVKDNDGKPVQVAIMAPAVTPWFSSLPGAGSNNPAFRIYDTDDFKTLNDMRTYYIDLDKLNKNANTTFMYEYSFKHAYGISGNLTPTTMNNLVEQLKVNDSLFESYIQFNSVFWKSEIPKDEYRGAQLCSMEFSDYPRYRECLSKYSKSTHRSSLSIFSLVTIIINLFV